MITFEEASRHGRGGHIKVKLTTKVREHGSEHEGPKGHTLSVTIGEIEFSCDGLFRYFDGATKPNPTLVDKDLETLKRRIRAHRK
jgi:hypothetical protein